MTGSILVWERIAKEWRVKSVWGGGKSKKNSQDIGEEAQSSPHHNYLSWALAIQYTADMRSARYGCTA